MKAAARKRPGTDSFIVCFYCNETFRSLSLLLEHRCSAEENISLDCEQLETFSDIDTNDLGQEVSLDSTGSIHENSLDMPRLVIIESESNVNLVCGTPTSGTKTECEKPVLGTQVNSARQEITEPASDALSDGVREISKLSFDPSEKRLLESNPDILGEEITNLAFHKPKEQLVEVNSSLEQKVLELGPNVDDDLNKPSPDLVLQHYEMKQSSPNACDKSPSIEEEVLQSSHSPLPVLESDSLIHDYTQMECISNEVCRESDAIKHDAKGLECLDSNMDCRPSSSKVESDSSNMFSRSSSIRKSLDSEDDQANSDDANDTISSSEKKTVALNSDHDQVSLHYVEIRDKALTEENPNITKHDSAIVKPCYVKVKDIFKSLSDTKISPQKIFSWKKKYYVCDVCYKFFRLKSDLNMHYLVHTVAKPYVCNICEKSFTKQYNLFAHQLTHIKKTKHVCSVCKKAFPKKSLLLRHKFIHNKEKPFSCDKCSKSFSDKSFLNEHYLIHSNERPFVCEICSASFGNKKYLRRHYYKHQNKDNVCEYYKTFKRKHHLEEHYNIHTNDKPYKCKFCSKSFYLLLTLNSHYSIVHRNERALVSPETIKTFADNSVGKSPVIQKIEKLTVDDKCEKKIVQKIEKSSIAHASTVPYRTRRKSFIPKRYLQPD